jgi:hypothetical protein
MPFLFSHLIANRFLSLMALLNLALLGALAYFVLAPLHTPAAPGAIENSQISSAPASASPDRPGLAGAASPSRASATTTTDREATSRVQSLLGTSSRRTPDAYPAAAAPTADLAAESTDATPTAQAANSPQYQAVAGGNAALASQIPLAFSVSSQGATNQQAAALGQLQQDFANQMSAGNPDPDSPIYKSRWQAAQPMNDQSFKQKFGWQPFVQAQLAPYHGGVN